MGHSMMFGPMETKCNGFAFFDRTPPFGSGRDAGFCQGAASGVVLGCQYPGPAGCVHSALQGRTPFVPVIFPVALNGIVLSNSDSQCSADLIGR